MQTAAMDDLSSATDPRTFSLSWRVGGPPRTPPATEPLAGGSMQAQEPGPAGSREMPRPDRSAGGADRLITIVQRSDHLETTLLRRGRALVCSVRALTRTGQGDLQRIADLLSDLTMAGLRAAPQLIAQTLDGIEIEGGAPLRRGTGRRRAASEQTTPETQERRSLAGAREDLDLLIGALHERGWVLGLTEHEGIALRGDGSVVLMDISGLRESPYAQDRRADQAWVDSLLQDQGRTVRRRIHGAALVGVDGTAAQGAAGEGMGIEDLPVFDPPDDDGPTLVRRAPGVQGLASADPLLGLPAPRRRDRTGRGSALRRVRDRGGAGRREPSGARVGRSLPSRRTLVLAGGAALAGAALLMVLVAPPRGLTQAAPPAQSSGAAAGAQSGSPGAGESPAASPALAPVAELPVIQVESDLGSDPAPAIGDPQELLQSLLEARNDYLLGRADTSPAAPGSPAEHADALIREAYRGTQVDGGGPRVTAAELLRLDSAGGTARLRASVQMPALDITPEGEATQHVPLQDSVVVLELHVEAGAWALYSTEPEDPATGREAVEAG